MQLAEDRWLAERFGHPVFTVPAEADPELVLEHAREAGPASYQARVPVEHPEPAAALTKLGFSIVSVGVTMSRRPGRIETPPSDVAVRDASPHTDRPVLDIAERGFTRTRFHLDPSIPNTVADRIKRDWAEHSLTGARGDGMLVAVRGDDPVGFLAGLSGGDAQTRVRVIDLIAVDESERDSGAGGSLVSRFLDDAEGSFDEVRVSTQAANPAATRFYERLGFTTAASAFDLHLHVGDPWPGM